MRQELQAFILLPTLCFAYIISLLALTQGDLHIADLLFQLEGGEWALRGAWLTSDLIHDQGRKLFSLMALLLLAAIALSYLHPALRPYRRDLWYLLICALITVAIVTIMKASTGVDCPWDLQRYGGEQAYVSLLGSLPQGQEPGRCFPAGHASGAYCWLGLFFLARRYRPRWRYSTLAGVIGLGLIFGVAQQLRGAHFMSHDVWTLYIAWMAAALCYFWLLRPDPSA